MTHMLNFFEQLFAHLPPLVFDFRRQQRPKVVIYTDTSFGEHRNGMGFLLFDQETNSQFVCDASCPDWLMSVWNDATSNPWLLSACRPLKHSTLGVGSAEVYPIL